MTMLQETASPQGEIEMLAAERRGDSYRQLIFAYELAENTRIAYAKGWECFCRFAANNGFAPLEATAEDVSAWMIRLAKDGENGRPAHPGSIGLYKSGVNKMFEINRIPSPCKDPLVRAAMKICRRDYGQPSHAVSPIRDYHLKAMIDACPPSPIGRRDAAILSLGFACALRRSELISLHLDDCQFLDDESDQYARMLVHIRKSKTDQIGAGQTIPVINGQKITPITHLRRWLEHRGLSSGPMFLAMKRGGHLRETGLHTSDIPRLVKRYAKAIGLDTAQISGHSLRVGFVTSAADHRAQPKKIMEVTRHSSFEMVMHYIRDAEQFDSHAGEGFL